MPLASLANLQWYGPCSSAVYLSGVGSVTAQPRGSVRSASSLFGSGAITYARPLRLIGSPALLTGSGAITFAQPRGYVNAKVTIKVNELTQDDVSGAVWQSFVSPGITYQAAIQSLLMGSSGNPWDTVIESGYTAGEIMQLIAAYTSGKTNIVDLGGGSATVTFRDLGDTKDRIVGDMTGSERTTITLDTDP